MSVFWCFFVSCMVMVVVVIIVIIIAVVKMLLSLLWLNVVVRVSCVC